MKSNVRLDFNVLIYPEDGWWIAHCLEMDLPAEGKSPLDAVKNLIDLANVQITAAMEEGHLDSIFSMAPPDLWRMFSIAEDFPLSRRPRKPVKPIHRLESRLLSMA